MTDKSKLEAIANETGLSLDTIAKALAGAKQERDPDIEFHGKAITLPGDPAKMPLREAIKVLKRKADDEEQETTLTEVIDAYPMDGAVAFHKAMKAIYGWSSPVPIPTFFGPKPPEMRSIKIGPADDDVIQVPWGRFVLPNVEGWVHTDSEYDGTKWVFQIVAQVRKKDAYIIRELADKARAILKSESIYRGKAIRLRTDSDGDMNINLDPEFLATNYVNPGELVLNPGEGEQIETSIWTPIRHTEACRAAQIPLKRGVLLEGPFGCGKTMTASHTAKICVDNGWTFILLDNVKGLTDALLFAQRYAPAVVFAEDAERVAGDREERGNDLLNTIDGILSKNAQVITVLTTNYVEKLHPAMLRPGRLDAVISVRAPEAEAVKRLIHIYGRGLIAENADLDDLGAELAGNIPATIREVVERSKLAMISRGGTAVSSHDLMVAARGMKDHLDLLKPRPVELTPEENLGKYLAEVVRAASNPNADKRLTRLENRVSYISRVGDQTHGNVNEIKDAVEAVAAKS